MEQTMNQDAAAGMMTGGMQKKNTGLIAGMVVCTVLAASGIAFGIYGMMQSSQKDNQISELKIEINDKTTKMEEFETIISKLNDEIEEAATSVETTTTTISDTTEQVTNNNNSDSKTAIILLGAILDKNDNRTVFKVGDCTADGPSVKCPVIVNEKNALISYNSNDSILRLTLPND